MKSINVHLIGKKAGIVCALFVIIGAFGTAGMGQCGASFTALAEAAAAIRSQTQMPAAKAVTGVNDRLTDNDGRNSIVGLWHIRFMIGTNTIQEAFQIWNEGGTEEIGRASCRERV